MAPFKEKQTKKKYKYDIISQKPVAQQEDMPRCFLADDLKTAEKLFNKFKKYINKMAYSYSSSTGLSKEDLFCEALIGLARAFRDWNKNDNFDSYAKFRIKDALNEFVRENINAVSIPVYIQKAQNNVKKIKQICEEHTLDYLEVLLNQRFPDSQEKYNELIFYIEKAAERAKVTYPDFIDRILLLPKYIEFSDYMVADQHEETLEAAIIVEQLKTCMTEEEKIICDGIMKDKTLKQIGEELGKSPGMISKKIKTLRLKAVAHLKKEK